MPVLHHRQQMLAQRQMASARIITDDNDVIAEPLWVVDEDYEKPQKEMDFPSVPLGTVPSRKGSRNNLRINTYPSAELYDRYMSSEEEPSPSPETETESPEEELKHKTPASRTGETTESVFVDEYKAEIAIAIPILAMGRPKLVDISNLAPMHKRKRTEKPLLSRSAAVKNAASRIPEATDENSPFAALEVTKVPTPEEPLPKRKDSLPALAPDSWLPDDNVHTVREEDEHYFPDLELRNPPTYKDYDPYSLDPPRLSPRNSYNTTGKKPGSVSRARVNSNPPVAMNNGWKGLTRSLSLAKKQSLIRTDQQVAKKPKMIARAANEREEVPLIPEFPVGGKSVD
ncbi:hypothetical protein MMC28_010260 [Mycoblastus sanguinarius]|nr:hypothetical protein [Mycoblastus sanguinarius]